MLLVVNYMANRTFSRGIEQLTAEASMVFMGNTKKSVAYMLKHHGTEEQNVAVSIAAHVSELGADMVTLCTHGRSGLRRVVSGSIAQQVLKRVSVPVLLARPQMQAATELRTILVPLDGTPQAETALTVATELARAASAQLYIVSVVPTVPVAASLKSVGSTPVTASLNLTV